jgi:hypothetical protein
MNRRNTVNHASKSSHGMQIGGKVEVIAIVATRMTGLSEIYGMA